MMIVGIIPARGGSKGVPRKNIRLLAGKPLISHTIGAALQCRMLSRVIVSTDDREVARISRECGAEVPFLRPKELAEDATPVIPVLQHAISQLEGKGSKRVDIVVLLEPTSPLREASEIGKCIRKLLDEQADSVITVCEAEHNPYFVMVRFDGDNLSPLIPDERAILGRTRRQDLPKVYRMNGAVFVVRRDILMEESRILTSNTRGFIMPQERSVNIDSELDLELAELLIKRQHHHKSEAVRDGKAKNAF